MNSAQESERAEGPDEHARFAIYRANGIPASAIDLFEGMVATADARPVGKGALGNVTTRLDSKKNGAVRQLESHQCELIYAYELEFDPDVVAYYNQVPCRGITRQLPQGTRHVTSAHMDFLVFRTNGVELVECKTPQELRALSAKGVWVNQAGIWMNGPYDEWAKQQGVVLKTWVAPERPGIYYQNLCAAYALHGLPRLPGEEEVCAKALKLLKHGGMSIADLSGKDFGFGPRHALLMLAGRRAFGPWQSTQVEDSVNFSLFIHPEQALRLDGIRLNSMAESQRPVTGLTDPILTASSKDLARARKKLQAVDRILRDGQTPSKRMRKVVRDVVKARKEGRSDLAECLTRFASSGNRLRRITAEHVELIDRLLREVWNRAKVERPVDLESLYRKECHSAGLMEIGISALRKARRGLDPTRHALSRGGMRGYQAVRPHTDPRDRSLGALGYGQLAHVDSTYIDMRVVEWLEDRDLPEALRPIVYVAMDSATGMPLGFAILFGSPRTEGLAMLMRDIVRRNGFLPRMFHVDRGPENRSGWFGDFCESTSIRYSPTAGSAWNSAVEATLKLVNSQVSVRLRGSTAPDAKGRKVDGRYKSRKTARLHFSTLYTEIEDFLFVSLPDKPGSGHASPKEVRAEKLVQLGPMGNPQTLDEAFLIRTSVPLKKAPKVSARGAIRLEEGTYGSAELLDELRDAKKIDEARLDCESAKVLYVRMGTRWIKAYRADCLKGLQQTLADGIFDFCAGSIDRAVDREKEQKLSDLLAARIEDANRELALPPAPIVPPVEEPPARHKSPKITEQDVQLPDVED